MDVGALDSHMKSNLVLKWLEQFQTSNHQHQLQKLFRNQDLQANGKSECAVKTGVVFFFLLREPPITV